MANSNYNNIELTEAEVQSLENPDIELEITESPSDDKASEATVEETSSEVTEPIAVDNFEIDGKDYSRDQILQWRDDSDNKDSWQKSNTEKAQGLSKWNKLAGKIQEDESFRNHLKDFYYDDPEAVKALGLDGDMTIPVQDKIVETPSEIESRLDVLEEIEGERVMEHRVISLMVC